MFQYEVPFHIQEEIMKRLPVKSLIQFRSVSKAWKSLIDSSEFIAAHSSHYPNKPQHLLLSYEYQNEVVDRFIFFQSYIDDETFPQQMSLLPLPPQSPQQIIRPWVVGISHGLVCICGLHPSLESEITLLWNPSIRKYIVIDLPGILPIPNAISPGLGFGVCPVTNEPKILSIKQSSWDVLETSYTCEVMVYTLSSGIWRSLSTNLPTERLRGWYPMVVTNRFIYWCGELPTRNCVMSFDVTNESFEAIDLPDSLARHDPKLLHITKLRESLAVLEYTGNICTVWMMEDGGQRSFTKLSTINTTYEIMGFRKSGVPLMKVTDVDDDEDDNDDELFKLVYEPNSGYYNVIMIGGFHSTFTVNSYMETLLMLGRSDCSSY